MSERTVIRVSGPDNKSFLQGLVTNDVDRLDRGLVYAALLTPQGKYIADFFLVPDADDILIDAPAALGDGLVQRLRLYKLRADVDLAPTDLHVHRGLDEKPDDAFDDPRHPALGWRAYRNTPSVDTIDWAALRVEHLIPESGTELHSDTFILEAGFERLNGVDFRKGCYVGQEVTARMKHKTTLRKGLARITLSAPVETGTQIKSEEKVAGLVHTVSGTNAIAYLRFDRVSDNMSAGSANVTCPEH